VELPDYLAPELNKATIGEGGLLDPSPNSVAGLEDDDIGAACDQVSGG
jgi:hypothetical protein